MKRLWIAALLMALLFTGCVESPLDTSAPPTTEPINTEPALYKPGTELEQGTGGAVRVYGLPLDMGGEIFNIGSDILLFAYGKDSTTLTRLTGTNGRPVQTVQLPGHISRKSNSVRIENNTLAYYDPDDRSIVFLDSMLQQTDRTKLPEDMVGAPVLSSDLKRIYYAADGQLRRMELDSGISSLLREQEMELFQPVALAASEQALECRCRDSAQNEYTEFISTADGRTLTVAQNVALTAHNERWFAVLKGAVASEYLFGIHDQISALYLQERYTSVISLGNMAVALLPTEAGLQADLFDLESGYRSASVVMPGIVEVNSLTLDAEQTGIWFIASDGQQAMLSRWEFGDSAIDENIVYTGIRYTPDSPDTEGLQRASQRMEEMSERFRLDMKLWDAVQSPNGYSLCQEYRGEVIDQVLDEMEATLALFPEGFFAQLNGGKLSVEIVHSVSSLSEELLQDPSGLAYWHNGKGHIVLEADADAGAAFCATLSHVMDAYIFSKSLAYDRWEQLNPAEFVYDLSYSLYESRQDEKWLKGEQRAFVNEFSKTFAKEDRASIFACALEEGNGEMFAAPMLQNKLQCICKAIRDAFGWQKDERAFPWEQYLQQ